VVAVVPVALVMVLVGSGAGAGGAGAGVGCVLVTAVVLAVVICRGIRELEKNGRFSARLHNAQQLVNAHATA